MQERSAPEVAWRRFIAWLQVGYDWAGDHPVGRVVLVAGWLVVMTALIYGYAACTELLLG